MNIAYNMDCLEAMKSMPDKFFDLAVVDPPYGGEGDPDAEKTFNGAIIGRFGGRFARYHIGEYDRGVFGSNTRNRATKSLTRISGLVLLGLQHITPDLTLLGMRSTKNILKSKKNDLQNKRHR